MALDLLSVNELHFQSCLTFLLIVFPDFANYKTITLPSYSTIHSLPQATWVAWWSSLAIQFTFTLHTYVLHSRKNVFRFRYMNKSGAENFYKNEQRKTHAHIRDAPIESYRKHQQPCTLRFRGVCKENNGLAYRQLNQEYYSNVWRC